MVTVNLGGLPGRIHKSFQAINLNPSISRAYQKAESRIPQVALFSFLFETHRYYGNIIPPLEYNINIISLHLEQRVTATS